METVRSSHTTLQLEILRAAIVVTAVTALEADSHQSVPAAVSKR